MKQLMKTLLVFVILIVVYKTSPAQTFDWAKQMGGTGIKDEGKSIAVDASGNIYTTGSFQLTVDFDPGVGVFNLTSAGQSDIFISKLDPSGNFLWAKQIGGGSPEISESIAIDFAGNLYTTGYFFGTLDLDPGISIFNLTSAGDLDVFISKLDSSGNFIWAKQLGGTNSDLPNSIAVDPSGNVYTTGYFFGTADFDPGIGTFNLTSTGNDDIFISKLNASGNFIWAKQMGGTDYDESNFIAVDAAENVYTTGFFYKTSDLDPGMATFNLTSAGDREIFISKLDPSGNFIWAKQMGGKLSDDSFSIAVDDSGNIYTTGDFKDTADFDPGVATFNLTSVGGSYDIFISKLDQFGNFIWAKQMGGLDTDYGKSITVDPSGKIYTAGEFQSTVDFDPGVATFNLTSAGTRDIFISKLDNTGNFISAIKIGGTNFDYVNSIDLDASGNIYSTGYFNGTSDFDPGVGIFNLTSAGGMDIFISKLNNIASGIVENIFGINCKLYPNPTSVKLTIELEKSFTHVEVNVKNVLGQEILSKKYFSTNRIAMDMEHYPGGVYFIELKADAERPLMIKIVKQ